MQVAKHVRSDVLEALGEGFELILCLHRSEVAVEPQPIDPGPPGPDLAVDRLLVAGRLVGLYGRQVGVESVHGRSQVLDGGQHADLHLGPAPKLVGEIHTSPGQGVGATLQVTRCQCLVGIEFG